MNKVLAIDMGATSIRGIIGYVENSVLQIEEVMRLSHEIIEKDGRRYWQWDELITAIVSVINKQSDLTSVACDTWGVDFGILDAQGKLIETPVSYRDSLHTEGFNEVKQQIDLFDLYQLTGNQIMSINSLFQYKALKTFQPSKYEQIDKILMTPDLINYLLTGNQYSEMTIASTSQMFDLKNQCWHVGLLDQLDLKSDVFAPVIKNGEFVGTTENSLLPDLINNNLKVYSIASHDTASAVSVTRAFFDPECLFLSSGTWSLIGGLTEEPILTQEAFDSDLTNETGFQGQNMFFKNITGLYLFEKLRDELAARDGERLSHQEADGITVKAEPFSYFLDIAAYDLDNITVLDTIHDYIAKTGQKQPDTVGEILRGLYESLIFGYMKTVEDLERILGKTYKRVQIIGGGSKISFLNQMIADALNKEVVAGPDEASGIGNIVGQLLALNEWESIEEAYNMVAESFEYKVYKPQNPETWQDRYLKIKELLT